MIVAFPGQTRTFYSMTFKKLQKKLLENIFLLESISVIE